MKNCVFENTDRVGRFFHDVLTRSAVSLAGFCRWLAIVAVWLVWATAPATAQQTDGETTAQDTLRISLLTCSPGQQSYELYGHTALLVEKPAMPAKAYNYGVFFFDEPHFVWHFVLGRPIYWLASIPAQFFYAEYWDAGRSVVKQPLNLSPTQMARLDSLLCDNALPDKARYPYNIFTNNCTSRALDKLFEALGDSLMVDADCWLPQTYRTILHHHSQGSPWLQFGQDLILGSAADTLLSARAQAAFPLTALQYLRRAKVCREGRWEPLVVGEQELFPARQAETGEPLLTPMATALFLVLLALYLTHRERRGKRTGAFLFDMGFFGVQTLGGCLVAFLFCGSAHPTVGSNWLITVLNPLALLFLLAKIRARRTGELPRFVAPLALLMLTGFFVGAFFQNYPPEIYLLALILLMRTLYPRIYPKP